MAVRPIDGNALKVRCFRSTEFNRDTGRFDLPVVPWHDIEDTDTLDYAQVIHARWLLRDDGEGLRIVCSHCGKESKEETPFCAQCGAKMDGGTKDG